MDIETMKEYLVSLGFAVDSKSLNQAKQSLGVANGIFNLFGGNVGKNMAIASASVIGFFASTTAAVVGFLDHTARAELEHEKFARRMGMSTDAARSFNTALDVMGVKLEDLWLSPELAAQFVQLRREMQEMRPPENFSYFMREIRDIGFEVTRLKATFSSAAQWIGYYLYAYLEKPLQTAKATLKSWNDTLRINMPTWSKTAAQVLSWFVRLGIAGVRGVGDLSNAVFGFLNKLPSEVKIAIAGIAAAGMLLTANPITLFIAAIAGALLLLDDYYTYLEGGESAFGDLWKWVDETKSRFDSFAEGLDIDEYMENLGKQLGGLGSNLKFAGSEALKFFDNLSKNETVIRTTKTLLEGIGAAIETIVSGLSYLSGGVGNVFEGFNDMLTGKKDAWNVIDTWKEQLVNAGDEAHNHLMMRKQQIESGMKTIFGIKQPTDELSSNVGSEQKPQLSDTSKQILERILAPRSTSAAPVTSKENQNINPVTQISPSPSGSENTLQLLGRFSEAAVAMAKTAATNVNQQMGIMQQMSNGAALGSTIDRSSSQTTEIKNSGNMSATFNITTNDPEAAARETVNQVKVLQNLQRQSMNLNAGGVIK